MKIEKRKDIPEPAVKQKHELHRSLRPPQSTWPSCGGSTLHLSTSTCTHVALHIIATDLTELHECEWSFQEFFFSRKQELGQTSALYIANPSRAQPKADDLAASYIEKRLRKRWALSMWEGIELCSVSSQVHAMQLKCIIVLVFVSVFEFVFVFIYFNFEYFIAIIP